MALIEWPLIEDADKAPDITEATLLLDYLYRTAYLEVFDHRGDMQPYSAYTWIPQTSNIDYPGSDFTPLTNTGSVKFSNDTDGSFFTVKARATGAYLDPNFDSDYIGAGSTSFTISFTGKNSANKVKLTSMVTVNNSLDHRQGYTEDATDSTSVFKDGLDTKDKTDDIVSKVASSKYDLNSETATQSQTTVTEKYVDSLDTVYSAAAGTNQEIYQTLKIANEYSVTERENSNGSSSYKELQKEIFSSEDRDVSTKLSQSKDVSYIYSLNESYDADGNVVSSESEDTSFKITYADQFVTNGSLSHIESSLSKINDNTGLEINNFSERLNYDYADKGGGDNSGVRKFSVALLEKSEEALHESGNSDSTVEVFDLSKFNYSDAVNSFAFSVKEVNISGTNSRGDYKDDEYKLNVSVDLKTADYIITAKDITEQTLEGFNYVEEAYFHGVIDRVTDYIDELKNLRDLADTEENGSPFADIGAVEFADFEGAFEYVSLLIDNTIKVLNQKGFEAFAGRGNDTVIGNIGADLLHGGTGNDILTGGAGADLFLFETTLDAKNNVDIIKDFSRVQGDKILLDNLVFNGSQEFNVARLATAAAVSANTLAGVVYDNISGRLYYNADGLEGNTTAFATLATHPQLAANDIDFYVGVVL